MGKAVIQRSGGKGRRRNRAFDETHAALIDTAVRLVSEKGIDMLSLSEVAREAGVNRTTVYYHFESREALASAVRDWSARQLASALAPVHSTAERIGYITRFVLENPEVLAMWIEDFLAPGHIGDRYPEWSRLVDSVGQQLRRQPETADIDPEVYCTLLLTWGMIGPRVYRASVHPELSLDEIVDRMTRSQLKMLQLHKIGID
jgi:AcrR family transcriptional regulator